jgi:glutamate-ammonia-ligase adenylyltransferase
MRVGIRDILGRDDVRDTHRTLADVAEICLTTVAKHQSQMLIEKYARPDRLAELSQIETPFVILGLGKLGGREPNYHSDLDVIFLYNSTKDSASQFEACLKDGTTCQFFFSELAKAITRFVSQSTGQGRLYEVDSRLRPTGKSGALAVSMDEFKRYFETGQGQLWERQSLCKARPIFGSVGNCELAMSLVRDAIKKHPWKPELAADIRAMRMAMQKDCTEFNLKRGQGGTVDVEFVAQMLQLKHASENDSVLVPGTRETLDRLAKLGFLDEETAGQLAEGYQLLRSVEARLRLMNTTARHDLPSDPKQLNKLAYLLNYSDAEELTGVVKFHRTTIRKIFDQFVTL